MTNYTIHNLAKNPHLQEGVDDLAQYWEEFMKHDVVADHLFGRLYDWFAEYQLAICDADNNVIARALSAPILWDGEDDSLSDMGWDWVLLNAVETYEKNLKPTAVSAVEISISPDYRGQGLSKIALTAMKENAKAHGFKKVVAPVRPSLKSRYPLTPIEQYIQWTQVDNEAPFDPWLRVHWRDGAYIVNAAIKSMEIRGSIADWEKWTNMRFPESGTYIISGALVPIEIDYEANDGVYFEPNVWMVHPLT